MAQYLHPWQSIHFSKYGLTSRMTPVVDDYDDAKAARQQLFHKRGQRCLRLPGRDQHGHESERWQI